MRKTSIALAFLVGGCGLFQEPEDGKNSLVALLDEPTGSNCSMGGVKITSGIDLNSDGVLDEAEVNSTRYVCNGQSSELDKQIVIPFGPNGMSAEDDPTIHRTYIVQFNAHDFPNVDSISYVLYEISTRTSSFGEAGAATFKLYDMTNSQYVGNGEIISDDIPKGVFAASKNMASHFPDQAIDIGLEIAPGSGNYAQTSRGFLVLHRR